MILRDYQQELVDRARHALRHHNRVIVQLATGGGKTPTFSAIAKQAVEKGNRVLILAHRRELIKQASNKLNESEVEHGIIQAGVPPKRSAWVQVASIQSLANRDTPEPALIIPDEGHHSTSPTWLALLNRWPNARVLAFSATPIRMTGAGLGTVFDHLICGPQVSWLIERGYLSPFEYYSIPIVDTSSLHVRAGDYMKEEVEVLVNNKAVVGNAVEHYRKHLDGKPTIVFCSSVAHAEAVAEAYREAGYRAASVDGKMDQDVRDRRIAGIGNGDLQLLTSCDLINEGLDVPGVVGIQQLRPSQSLALVMQQWGRGSRVFEGKKAAIILDHVGNYRKHGLPDMPRTWRLDKGVKADEDIDIKHCPQCSAVVISPRACPYCGFEFELPDPTEAALMEEVDGILQRITPEDVNALWERAKKDGTMKSYHDWGRAKARLNGEKYKPGTGYFAFKNARRNRRVRT